MCHWRCTLAGGTATRFGALAAASGTPATACIILTRSTREGKERGGNKPAITFPRRVVLQRLKNARTESEPAAEILRIVPGFTNESNEPWITEDKSVRLFFFEDAPIDMGLVKALYDNWEYVLMIMEDYTTWVLENGENNKSFLSYGRDQIPSFLDLEKTRDLLSTIVGNRPMNIRKAREDFQ